MKVCITVSMSQYVYPFLLQFKNLILQVLDFPGTSSIATDLACQFEDLALVCWHGHLSHPVRRQS